MLIIAIASAVAIGVIAFVLAVGPRDIPAPEPVSPVAHLDERKAAIYDGLRDLQFEYRVGKLSDQDYQNTKRDLQKELAAVMAETDRIRGGAAAPTPAAAAAPAPAAAAAPAPAAPAPAPAAAPAPTAAPAPKPSPGSVCPSCGAAFPAALKFCGECGKPMKAVGA